MIKNENELKATQQRIIKFQEIILKLRKSEKPANYYLMIKGYLKEIEKMETEIKTYLQVIPELNVADAEQNYNR